eukprot:GEZU01010832.1.p1 GENE.GEZU01010832.1~~GEZU01010832.1.p1  ORF type:complete len:393 (+),score=97.34 GEZU01010832.1:80-1258(+)
MIRGYNHCEDYSDLLDICKNIPWDHGDYLHNIVHKFTTDALCFPYVYVLADSMDVNNNMHRATTCDANSEANANQQLQEKVVSFANLRLMIPGEVSWIQAVRTHHKHTGRGYATSVVKKMLEDAVDNAAFERFGGAINNAWTMTYIENKSSLLMFTTRLGFELLPDEKFFTIWPTKFLQQIQHSSQQQQQQQWIQVKDYDTLVSLLPRSVIANNAYNSSSNKQPYIVGQFMLYPVHRECMQLADRIAQGQVYYMPMLSDEQQLQASDSIPQQARAIIITHEDEEYFKAGFVGLTTWNASTDDMVHLITSAVQFSHTLPPHHGRDIEIMAHSVTIPPCHPHSLSEEQKQERVDALSKALSRWVNGNVTNETDTTVLASATNALRFVIMMRRLR